MRKFVKWFSVARVVLGFSLLFPEAQKIGIDLGFPISKPWLWLVIACLLILLPATFISAVGKKAHWFMSYVVLVITINFGAYLLLNINTIWNVIDAAVWIFIGVAYVILNVNPAKQNIAE